MYNQYYEKDIILDTKERSALLNIYEAVARENGFTPDYDVDRNAVDFETDEALLTSVLYHVETCGRAHPEFPTVAHLFDEPQEEADADDDEEELDLDMDAITMDCVEEEIHKLEELSPEDSYWSAQRHHHPEGTDTHSLYYNGMQLACGMDIDTLYTVVQALVRKGQIDRDGDTI